MLDMTPGVIIAILILVGLGMIGIGLWMLLRERKKNAVCSEQVTAQLLHYDSREESSMEDGQNVTTTIYYPVFQYMANGGEQIVRHSGSNKRRWKTGAQVHIFYNPEEPGMIRVPGDWGNYFGFAVATILGLACLAMGIFAAAGVLEINL